MGKPLEHILLITDMDDTLLSIHKKISDVNLQAIKKFQQLGGSFTIATGRSIPAYLPYHEMLQPDAPVVLNNGAVLYEPYSDQIIWNSILPYHAKSYVQDVASNFPDVGIEILLGKEIFVVQMSQEIKNHMEHENLVHTVAPFEQISDRWYKVLYATKPEGIRELSEYLKKQNHTDVTYMVSTQCYCEMLPCNTSKGDALRLLLDCQKLTQKKVYAVGDYYNDIQMLQTADVGIAVSNAPDEVKKYAKIIVTSNQQDGVAAAIECILEREL